MPPLSRVRTRVRIRVRRFLESLLLVVRALVHLFLPIYLYVGFFNLKRLIQRVKKNAGIAHPRTKESKTIP